MTPDDLARAYEFLLRNDLVGTRTESFRWGLAVFAPEFPLRHDSNFLSLPRLPPSVDAPALAAEADRLQGAAGLRHRCVMVNEGGNAERLVPGFTALGWSTHRGVVMAQRRPAPRSVDTSGVVEADAESLRAAREREVLRYPWADPEVAGQLVAARALVPCDLRNFAAFVDGVPVSWVELAVDGDVAQVEALATVEGYRRRGLATRVLWRAIEEARHAGARLVFLCADGEDWPKDFYSRLGFDEIGRYARFTRVTRPPT